MPPPLQLGANLVHETLHSVQGFVQGFRGDIEGKVGGAHFLVALDGADNHAPLVWTDVR